MKLNVFGRVREVVRESGEWVLYVPEEGKRRRIREVVIPRELSESEIVTYLADLFHESATPERPDVEVLS